MAEDSPGKPSDSRKSSTEVLIDILDVNDNPPTFEKLLYTAVIPENAPVNAFVVKIMASDPDEGPGGEIRYDLLNEGDANGLLSINATTGEVRTKVVLTGKGRSDPYELVIRAQDNGAQVPKQVSLFSDVNFILYIGDSNTNDGIPVFFAPKIGHIANVTEVCHFHVAYAYRSIKSHRHPYDFFFFLPNL
jgi:Cadherin domain